MLRVIAGSAKNRKLLALEDVTRPVTDRVKTVIFDLLREHTESARVLDLFAGSGAYGIEALSRGASAATFVEANPQACELINQNLATCAFTDQAQVICAKLPGALSQLSGPWDLIFCDPPFTQLEQFNLNDYKQLITPENIFVLRYPAKAALNTASFDVIYRKTLGTSEVLFLRRAS